MVEGKGREHWGRGGGKRGWVDGVSFGEDFLFGWGKRSMKWEGSRIV